MIGDERLREREGKQEAKIGKGKGERAKRRRGDLVLRRSEIAVDRGSLPLPALMIGDESLRERLKGMQLQRSDMFIEIRRPHLYPTR
jgi:hypothetical protein